MNCRRASTADIPALLRVINAAYRVEDFFVDGDRTSIPDLYDRMNRPDCCFLVCDGETPEALDGAVFVELRGERGYFGMLSVDPGKQRRGIGRKLVLAVEQYCRDAGCLALDLDVVNLRQELPAFYLGLGFVTGGTLELSRSVKLTKPAHLVIMSKPL